MLSDSRAFQTSLPGARLILVKMLRLFLLIFVADLVFANVTTTDSRYIMKIAGNRRNSSARIRTRQKFGKREDEDEELRFFGVDNAENEIFIPEGLEPIITIVDSMEENQCGRDARAVFSAAKKRQRWALQMLDSSAKLPEGVLYGTFYQLGNFDECLAVRQKQKFTNETALIKGKYCLANIKIKSKNENEGRSARSFKIEKKKKYRGTFENVLHWGFCMPSSCTNKDAENFLVQVLEVGILNKSVSVNIAETDCYQDEEIPLSNSEVAYGVVVGIFVIFVVLSTAYHWIQIHRSKYITQHSLENGHVSNTTDTRITINQQSTPGTLHSVLLCFSLIHNVKKFLNTKPHDMNFDCISGIKLLSMITILSGHALIFLVGSPMQNIIFYDQALQEVKNGIFVNNPLLVDTFLFISGFLMCFILLIELEKRKGKINFLVIYVARYVRLTPSYIIVLGFYCTWFLRTGTGPLWNTRILVEQNRCLESWWANILYINNYVKTDHLCMFQSWYLAVDTQLFILAPIVIYPLWKMRKLGLSILGVCTFISIIMPAIITFVDKLDPTFMPYAPEVIDLVKNSYFINTYIKTHMRANSYCIGILFGYIVHKLQSTGTKISPKMVTVGWITSCVFGVVAMFSVTAFYLPGHEYNRFESAVYASLHRVAWCIAIGWVITACITQQAVLVNKFLSWKLFIPLCRITYCSYLVNGIIELYSSASIRTPIYMSYYHLGSSVISHVILTFSLAFVLCILFESPIHGLEKILLQSDRSKNSTANGKRREDQ